MNEGEAVARETWPAVVWHCDADAFFAACHLAVDPRLRGLPLVVGGDPTTRHGIVLTATYEARRYGIKTAMPLAQAMRLCPSLTVVPPDGGLYRQFSQRLRRLWDEFSPLVEVSSVDEAWLDMGQGALRPYRGDAVAGARRLQQRALEEVGISVSIGISVNKMLAKQASDMDKPAGITPLGREDVPRRLWPLPVRALYGVGPKGAERLAAAGIRTVGDLANADADAACGLLGAHASILQLRARGLDSTPVRPVTQGDEQSLSVERTLARDVATVEAARPHLLALADELAGRLRHHRRWGQTVVLKYKTREFRVHSRQTTLPTPTQSRDRLYRAAVELYRTRPHPDPVRLLGLGVATLRDAPGDLFESPRREALDRAVDTIRDRFGDQAIGPLAARSTPHGTPSAFLRRDRDDASTK
jgi:DNA polymerase-4